MVNIYCGAYCTFISGYELLMLEKQKSYFYFVSWNTLSHSNIIGLTHTGHTQVIVEVNTPFTSLCGYLADINSDGVVRQPLSHSLFP